MTARPDSTNRDLIRESIREFTPRPDELPAADMTIREWNREFTPRPDELPAAGLTIREWNPELTAST